LICIVVVRYVLLSSFIPIKMKIFKDLYTGDEMLSDALPYKEVDGIALNVETKNFAKTLNANFDIGANPSGEGGGDDEGFDGDQTVTVNNLVDAHKLVQTQYDKKSYLQHIKAYMKRLLDTIKEKNPSRAEAFQKQAQEFVKKIIANFDQYEFYTGEQMDPEAMVALKYYSEDGLTPFFYFWKDGLREEKY